VNRLAPFAVCIVAFACFADRGSAQVQTTLDRDAQYQISEILRDARDEVRKHYYDPKLHGLDWDARYRQYAELAAKTHNLGEAFSVVAAFLSGLEDSHVFFIPPERMNRYEDGYRFELIGDACYITQIRPMSDAESKLHKGDQILTLDGYNLNRQDFHDLRYFVRVLSPMPAAQLVVRAPDGSTRTVVVKHTVKTGKQTMDLTSTMDYITLVTREENEVQANRSRIVERGNVAIWKLREFDLDFTEVEHFIGIARKHKGLVLDLRGNGGGRVDTLKVMLGYLMDHDVKIADRVERKDTKELIAKRKGNPFTGKLIVLVDSGSASASELLARVVQLEHRGTVVGDATAGAVMESRIYPESRGVDTKFFYDFSVTEANLMMRDGKSLERTGVIPDELVNPTGPELAAGRDPVLAHAVELAGGTLEAEEAGKLFPFEWPPVW
jgi:C-terminal processing protease CtpA/Prc